MASRPRGLAAAAGTVLGCALLAAAGASAQEADAQADERVIFPEGAVHLAPQMIDGEIVLGIKDSGSWPIPDPDDPWYSAPDVTLHVGPTLENVVPDDPDYAFLGEPGVPVWETAPTGVPGDGELMFGVSTHDLPGEELDGQAAMSLLAVDGPGEVITYTSSTSFVNTYFNSRDGLPDTWPLSSGRRQLPVWAFTEPGHYCLDLQARAASAVDGQILGQRQALSVVVGDYDPATAPACEQPDPAPLDPDDLDPDDPDPDDPDPDDPDPDDPDPDDPDPDDPDPNDPDPDDPAPEGPVVFDGTTHVDVAALLDDDGFHIQIHQSSFGRPESWHDLADSVFYVPPEAEVDLPDDPQEWPYGSPGAVPGERVWRLPSAQEPGVLWAGYGAVVSPDHVTETISWALDGVTSPDGGPPPGEVVLFTLEALNGQAAMFSTRVGLPDGFRIPPGGHGHPQWDFTAEGIYCLHMSMETTLASGEPAADRGVLTAVVGDLDPHEVEPCEQTEVPDGGTHPWEPETVAAPETPLVIESEDRDAADAYRFVPTLTGGDLDVGLWHGSHADSGELWDIGDVVFQVGPTHRATVASSLVPWAGDEGQQVWRVSPQQPRRVGHGWDTFRVSAEDLDGPLAWELNGVDGPGEMVMYQDWRLSDDRARLSNRPDHAVGRFDLPLRRAENANWTFSDEGVHCVDVTWSGISTNGEQVASRHAMTFVVGDVDPWEVEPCEQPDLDDPAPGGPDDPDAPDDSDDPGASDGSGAPGPGASDGAGTGDDGQGGDDGEGAAGSSDGELAASSSDGDGSSSGGTLPVTGLALAALLVAGLALAAAGVLLCTAARRRVVRLRG